LRQSPFVRVLSFNLKLFFFTCSSLFFFSVVCAFGSEVESS
jgi:hypothetical protein